MKKAEYVKLDFGPRAVFATLSLLVALPLTNVGAELPGSVSPVNWCPATKDCLDWPVVEGALAYHVYRGQADAVSGLLDSTVESCRLGDYAEPTTGSFDDPAPSGAFHWYLVTASNDDGEGGAGGATTGPRAVDSSGACSASPDLVINEVDYDQAGTDSDEFVELYNPGESARDLSDLKLVFVNGSSSAEYERVDLGQSGASLPAGGYLVVGSANVVASLPFGTPSVTLPGASNNIQNGAPDAIALFDAASQQVLDALSYEGSIQAAQINGVAGTFDLVEGRPTPQGDSSTVDGSLNRQPNGQDTDDAAADWAFLTETTPGLENPPPAP